MTDIQKIHHHVRNIQSHVTHLSAELNKNAIHGQEVVVGGRITGIVPPSDLIDDERYIFFVDDYIDSFHVLVPKALKEAFSDKLQLNQIVFFEGFANVVTRIRLQQEVREVSVIAYGLKDISSKE